MIDKTSKNVALIIVAMGSFLTPYMSSAVNIALPAIGREFQMSAVALSWIATTYLMAAAIFLVPFGRIADIYGRKRIYVWGVFIYTLSAALLAISNTEIQLLSFRILEGFGSAMLFGTGVAILTSVFPPGERGKAIGSSLAATYFGLSMGPFLGGFLTEHFGWRAVFLVNLPLGLLILVLVKLKLKGEWIEAKGEKVDFIGSGIYALALILVIYGLSALPTVRGILTVLIGLFSIALFAIWEMRIHSPILDINLFRGNRVFALSNIAAFLNYSSTYAIIFFLSLYLQYIKGLSPEAAGMLLLVNPVMQAVFSPFAGRLSDRIEPRIVASVGMCFTVVGLFMLIFLGEETSQNFIVGSLLMLGLGFALFASPNTNAIMSSVSKKFYGVASGMVGTMRLTGQMFSQGIAMLVSAIYLGSSQIVPGNYPQLLMAMKAAFMILTVLCTLGIIASLARGKMNPQAIQR
jgi:EmrB/QacA subfamily drug resistance transporter